MVARALYLRSHRSPSSNFLSDSIEIARWHFIADLPWMSAMRFLPLMGIMAVMGAATGALQGENDDVILREGPNPMEESLGSDELGEAFFGRSSVGVKTCAIGLTAITTWAECKSQNAAGNNVPVQYEFSNNDWPYGCLIISGKLFFNGNPQSAATIAGNSGQKLLCNNIHHGLKKLSNLKLLDGHINVASAVAGATVVSAFPTTSYDDACASDNCDTRSCPTKGCNMLDGIYSDDRSHVWQPNKNGNSRVVKISFKGSHTPQYISFKTGGLTGNIKKAQIQFTSDAGTTKPLGKPMVIDFTLAEMVKYPFTLARVPDDLRVAVAGAIFT